MKKVYSLLFEEERIDTPEKNMTMSDSSLKARKAPDSVDDQIDGLILRYEASSIRDEEIGKKVDGLLESLNKKNFSFLLEQDEEEGTGAGTDATEEEGGTASPAGDEAEAAPAGAVDPEGSEKMNVEEPAEEGIPDLDIDAFTARTVRLIVNYRSLLKIEEAIGNRIKNFLDINYGEKYVQQYIDILESQYGISLEEFRDERDTKDEKFAVGAFAGGTGGLGGGG